ncbi:MAG: ATP-binding protein [Actinomycetales bacterium]
MTDLPATAAMSLLALPFLPGSVPVARRALRAALEVSGVPPRICQDLDIVVSELVTNAIRYARPLPHNRVVVRWRVTQQPHDVVVGVLDGGATTRPRVTQASMAALGGRGLTIVETLADEWGVDQEDGATVVWARMALDPAHSRELAYH